MNNTANNLSNAELLLLSKFLRGNSISYFNDANYWNDVLKESVISKIKSFIVNELIEEAPLDFKLDRKYKVTDFKKILLELGLKQSGNKKELIKRLIENDFERMNNRFKSEDVYLCTQMGSELANKYLDEQASNRFITEQKVIEYLSVRDFENTCRIIAEYESKQVFPRGMGIDWNDYNSVNDIRQLNYIFNEQPKILLDLSYDLNERIKMGAALMYLWGTSNITAYFENIELPIKKYNFNTACRMLLFHSNFLRDKQRMLEVGINQVKILGCGEDSCNYCKKFNNKIYNIIDVPELPFEECGSEFGCRCCIVAEINI